MSPDQELKDHNLMTERTFGPALGSVLLIKEVLIREESQESIAGLASQS